MSGPLRMFRQMTEVAYNVAGQTGVISTRWPSPQRPLLSQRRVMATPQSTTTYRDILGFPGYRVGDDGSVWSLWKRIPIGRGRGTKTVLGTEWHRLKTNPPTKRHVAVELCIDGVAHSRLVHRLVLEAFIGPCPDGMEGCHEDGDPTNNALTNLRWDTPKGNKADSFRHGTVAIGERHGKAKLTAEIVRAIRDEFATGTVTQTELAKKYGVSRGTIQFVIARKVWAHVS